MLPSDGDDQALPMFFELLSDGDKKEYLELRKTISNSDKRYKKNKRIESLQEALDMIHKYCIRNDSNDWKRFLVCGVCWMAQDIAINTRQLRLLVDKCKSSINGALSKMGYSTAPIKSSITAALLTYIPFLKGNFVEQRQWTVRRKIQFSPLPPMRTNLIPTYNMYQFQTPEPGTPYIPWNYSAMSSDSSTSPETPEELEIRKVFGVQNYHQGIKTQNINPMIQSNQIATNSSFLNNGSQVPISNASNLPYNTNKNDNTDLVSENDNSNDIDNSTELDLDVDGDNDPIFYNEKEMIDTEYNFLTDPCCCCPVNWSTNGDDECFTMA